MIPFIKNFRKFKLILCERKRAVLLGPRRRGMEEKDRWITGWMIKFLRVLEMLF